MLILGWLSQSTAQLINPSFELYSALPDNTGQFSKAIGWTNAGSGLAAPDYYHYSANSFADLPQTPMATINSFEGNALMGFCATGQNGTNFREYLSTNFTSPLEVGKTYLLTFRISNGEKTDVSTAGLATSRLGVHFSSVPMVQNGTDPINAVPHFRIDTLFYSANWRQIAFTFVATQPFTTMTLGVFMHDNQIQIEDRVPGNSQFAYYFVDDFYLKQVPIGYDPTAPSPGRDDVTVVKPKPTQSDIQEEPFFVPNSFTPNSDGKNDVFRPVAGTITEWEMNIYSTWGERLFTTKDPNIGWDGSFNNQLAGVGSYVYEVLYRTYDDDKGWQELAKRGTLQLIR